MFKNFFKDTIIYGMSVASAKLLLFLSIPLFTRVMSVEEYGIIGFIGSLIGLIGVVMKIGTNNAVQRYYFDVEDKDKNNVINSGLKVLFVFSTILMFLSFLIVAVFENYFYEKNISLVLLFIAIIYIFLLQYIVFIKDIMRLYFKPWIYFYLELAPTLMGVGFALSIIYYFGLKQEGYFLGYTLGAFIVVLVSFISLKKYFLFKEKSVFKKDLLLFGYPFIFVGLASWVFQSADRWMLLELTGAEEVGLYSVAYQISSVLLLVVTTFGIVWSPYSMKLLKHKLHKDIYAIVGIIWYLLIVYIAFILSLFFNDIVKFVLDERYYASVGTGVVLVTTIIFIGTVQMSVLGISIAKKTKVLPWITWSIALLNIILNYYLIPQYFAIGAAISTLLSNLLLTVVYFIYSQKFYYIPYSKIKLLAITMIIILFYGVFFFNKVLDYTIAYKIVISIVLSIFFIIWVALEGKKIPRLVGLYEK